MVARIIAAATLIGMAAPAPAQTPAPTSGKTELPAFGMIGLAKGQLATLNLVLLEAVTESHPGCQVTASFVDADGSVFNDLAGNPVTETFTLQPQIASELAVHSTQVVPVGKLRTSIRAVLTPPSSPFTPSRCTCLMANLELVNANGQTVVLDYGRRNWSQGPESNPPIPSPPPDSATPSPPPLPLPLVAADRRCKVLAD
jgi:hypothetical protein